MKRTTNQKTNQKKLLREAPPTAEERGAAGCKDQLGQAWALKKMRIKRGDQEAEAPGKNK